jgi:hypothetical protein
MFSNLWIFYVKGLFYLSKGSLSDFKLNFEMNLEDFAKI